jgi:hypothetical protein
MQGKTSPPSTSHIQRQFRKIVLSCPPRKTEKPRARQRPAGMPAVLKVVSVGEDMPAVLPEVQRDQLPVLADQRLQAECLAVSATGQDSTTVLPKVLADRQDMLPVLLEVPLGEQDSPSVTQEVLAREQDRLPALQEMLAAEQGIPTALQEMQRIHQLEIWEMQRKMEEMQKICQLEGKKLQRAKQESQRTKQALQEEKKMLLKVPGGLQKMPEEDQDTPSVLHGKLNRDNSSLAEHADSKAGHRGRPKGAGGGLCEWRMPQ